MSTDIIDFSSVAKSLDKLHNPYVGNKRKIVAKIVESLEQYQFNYDKVLDLFSGSSVVSIFFKLLGKKVISNDLLTSSYYNALVFVENSHIVLKDKEIDFLCKNDNPEKNDFIRQNYTTRFTPEESLFLDNYRANVELLSNFYQDNDLRIAKAYAIVLIEQYVMNKCFLGGRLNNGQILAKLDHRKNHTKNFSSSILNPLEMTFYFEKKGTDLNYEQIPHLPLFKGTNGQSLNLDCLDALKHAGDVNLAYIDPPYGGDQSDYAYMFSFCEEYIYSKKLNELPHIANSKKFVSKKDYEKNFIELLESLNHIPQWAISYNDSSWNTSDGIVGIISKYRKEVHEVKIEYDYKYRKGKSSAMEYLFLAR